MITRPRRFGKTLTMSMIENFFSITHKKNTLFKMDLTDLYNKHIFLQDGDLLTEEEKIFFKSVTMNMDETIAALAIHKMSDFLSRYYEKKVIILLDEYDTPVQEARKYGFAFCGKQVLIGK